MKKKLQYGLDSIAKIEFYEEVYTSLKAAEEYETLRIQEKYEKMRVVIDMIMTNLHNKKDLTNKVSQSENIRSILNRIGNKQFTFQEISEESGSNLMLVRRVVERTNKYKKVFSASSGSPALYMRKV